MNRIVNTNFTGDNLSKVNRDNLGYDQVDEIFDGLDKFCQRRKYFRDANDIDEMNFVRALVQIEAGVDNDKKIFDFLERIDSTLVYHTNLKKMSKREILCLYLNTICSWSIIFKEDNDVEDDERIYKLFELYSDFKDFVYNELGLSEKKIIDYKSFKKHMAHHSNVKPRGTRVDGYRLSAESVVGLPQQKLF